MTPDNEITWLKPQSLKSLFPKIPLSYRRLKRSYGKRFSYGSVGIIVHPGIFEHCMAYSENNGSTYAYTRDYMPRGWGFKFQIPSVYKRGEHGWADYMNQHSFCNARIAPEVGSLYLICREKEPLEHRRFTKETWGIDWVWGFETEHVECLRDVAEINPEEIYNYRSAFEKSGVDFDGLLDELNLDDPDGTSRDLMEQWNSYIIGRGLANTATRYRRTVKVYGPDGVVELDETDLSKGIGGDAFPQNLGVTDDDYLVTLDCDPGSIGSY